MPKGDAEQLRADLDDGYARVSNLLLEAMCAAPLQASEYRAMIHIIRRTYGWARGRDPEYRADVITAREVSEGTGLEQSTARAALRSLREAGVLTSEITVPGGPLRYGINPAISEWGHTREWDTFRARLVDARAGEVFDRGIPQHTPSPTANPVSSSLPRTPTGHLGEDLQLTPQVSYSLPPTGNKPKGHKGFSAPTESFTENGTENGGDVRAPEPAKLPNDAHMILCNNTDLTGLVRQTLPGWKQAQRDVLVCEIARYDADPNTPITRDDLQAALQARPPALSYERWPDRWVREQTEALLKTRASPPRPRRSAADVLNEMAENS